jgi:hypothetical protein
MNNEQATPNAAGSTREQAAGERCVCREVADRFNGFFQVPPNVREHLNNSRVEFLKAIRAAIDQRIEHLSSKQQHGSHIPVE